MIRLLFSRLLQTAIVLYLIATAVFFMMKAIPGGPFSEERNVSPFILERLEEQYGLNDPTHVQYFRFIQNISPKKLHLPSLFRMDLKEGLGIDFGYSYRYEGRTVNELIKESFPISLELGIYSILLASVIGMGIGTIAALNQNSKWDYLSMSMIMLGVCIPAFVMGPVLILIFGFWAPEPFRLPVLFWEPTSSSSLLEQASHKILPTLTLALFYGAGIARLTRGSMLEVLYQDFIRTARAKGLKESTILFKHGLRSGLIPVISYLGPVAAHLVTGSFIVEFIFMLPGMGRHVVNAALNRDYTMIMGTVLLYAAILITFNLIVDWVVIALNPKLRLSEAR